MIQDFDDFTSKVGVEEYFDEALALIRDTKYREKLKQLTALYLRLYKSMHRLPIETQEKLDDIMRKQFIHFGGGVYTGRSSNFHPKVSREGMLRKARHEWEAEMIRKKLRK
jgi:hypothetical protein